MDDRSAKSGDEPEPEIVLDEAMERELMGLSLYEKKARLVNRELDNNAMGRYQWWIWALCGFGYFIDLMWAQAFGLVASAMQNELGFADDQYGNIFVAFNSGLTAGAFVWGIMVDIVGRRWAFNLTCLFSSVFGLCLGIPSTYNGILVLAAFTGFGVGGNVPIDTTICLEFLPQNRRFLLALLSIFQPLGVVVCAGITYGFVPKYACLDANGETPPPCDRVAPGELCCTKQSNMGWRYTLFTVGAITLLIFFLRFFAFNFQESPKFLLYRGRDAKAIKVLEHIARFNGRACGLSLADFETVAEDTPSVTSDDSETPVLGGNRDTGDGPGTDGGGGGDGMGAAQKKKSKKRSFRAVWKAETDRYKRLFATPTAARLTTLVWVAYIFDYWSFTVAGSFLPTILLKKNASLQISEEETYRNYVIIYLPGIVGVALGSLMYKVPRIGRQWGMIVASAMMGVSLMLFATVNTEASNVGLNVMEYFFQSAYNSILYGWTPEVFAAPVRGTACGVASFWGRLFSIIAPLIAQAILPYSLNGVLYMAGAAAFGSTLAIILLPAKGMGAQSY